MAGKINIPKSEFLTKKYKEELEKMKGGGYVEHGPVHKAIAHQGVYGTMAKDTPEQRVFRKSIRPDIEKYNESKVKAKEVGDKYTRGKTSLGETVRADSAHQTAKSNLESKLKTLRGMGKQKGRGFPVGTERQRKGGIYYKTSQGWKLKREYKK